jgi:sulfur-carrier protein
MIRVILPLHLRTLARVDGEVELDVPSPVTATRILNALESRYPMLRGTVREHETGKRRARVRFFADGVDITHEPPDTPLADGIGKGEVPFMIIGAIAGG